MRVFSGQTNVIEGSFYIQRPIGAYHKFSSMTMDSLKGNTTNQANNVE